MGLIMFLHLSTSEMLHKSPAMDDWICLLLLTVYLRAEILRLFSAPIFCTYFLNMISEGTMRNCDIGRSRFHIILTSNKLYLKEKLEFEKEDVEFQNEDVEIQNSDLEIHTFCTMVTEISARFFFNESATCMEMID